MVLRQREVRCRVKFLWFHRKVSTFLCTCTVDFASFPTCKLFTTEHSHHSISLSLITGERIYPEVSRAPFGSG